MATIRLSQLRLKIVGAAIVAALLGPAPSMAQPDSRPATPLAQGPAPSTPVSPLTVQAPPASPEVLEKQARGFVESYAAPTPKLDQYARWFQPACVLVTGLVPEQAAEFRTGVEKVAKAVGAPVGPSGCAPNVQIAFTNEPQRTLDVIAARNSQVLGFDGVKTVTRPIQAWYATATLGQPGPKRGEDIRPTTAPPTSVLSMATEDNGRERGRDTRGLSADRRCIDYRSPTCPHSGFLNVLIIVDVGHMGDVSVGLTSDYLAMLALSQARSLNGCMALPSVLDLYASVCPGRELPSGLTPADMAYLTSLYAADLTVEKAREQSDIAKRMAKILTAAREPAR